MTTLSAEPSRPPLMSRINPRLITIVVVFGILVGVPAYSLVKHQLSHGIEHAGDHENVDLKTLGNFIFNDQTDTVATVPERFRDLDGKKVALEGYIWSPNSSGDRPAQFQLVYNIQKCCFAGPPQVQERVFAKLSKATDVSAPDTSAEVRCVGTLHVKLQRDPKTSTCTQVYSMDVQRIEPL